MNADYKETTLHFRIEPDSEKIIEIDNETKSSIIQSIRDNIDKYLDDLKEYLNKNQINSPEKYKSHKENIQNFIQESIRKHLSEIKSILPKLED